MGRYFVFCLMLFEVVSAGAQGVTGRFEMLNGRQVYIAWKGELRHRPVPVLLALHGSGRSAESYAPGSGQSVPFYVRQRDLALQAGYLFVSISNGSDTWGTDAGMQAILDLVRFVKKAYGVEEKWTLWASSAGGVMLGRIIRFHPGLVGKALGTFPVYDLADSYQNLKSAREAWSSPEAFNSINPAGYPGAFVKIPYLVFHGKADKAVPLNKHSERLRDEVNALGGKVSLKVVDGGHSTQNFNLYDDDLILDFLNAP
ncbi:hypothetical protein GCM10023091_37140 [Ravibacter arvi]|uniref:Peptidase S9 prolyl oligopeptidase catalytic domain-containing protein n=1 Tax=Ravibacter arvi TaxID=2051041 RepID=A0ABP8M8Y4_9BACT